MKNLDKMSYADLVALRDLCDLEISKRIKTARSVFESIRSGMLIVEAKAVLGDNYTKYLNNGDIYEVKDKVYVL
jgi:hypothetical protein